MSSDAVQCTGKFTPEKWSLLLMIKNLDVILHCLVLVLCGQTISQSAVVSASTEINYN
jgi:hypothetical protein